MRRNRVCLAVDLGAGSGRVVAGIYDGARLRSERIEPFPQCPVKETDGWHWNLERLFAHVKQGIALAAKKYGDAVVSVGVDTWGVDYGLLDADGKLLRAPFQYRDSRTQGMEEEAFRRMPRKEIYQRTGIQFMFFNTLFQLLAEANSPARLEKAERLIVHAGLDPLFFDRHLRERKIHRQHQPITQPSHAGMGTAKLSGPWDCRTRIFGKLVDAGTVLGELQPGVAAEVGAKELRVIAPAGHDTASAVVGVPAEESEPVFLSSGTWSCMGRELNQPVISEESYQAAFPTKAAFLARRAF